MQSLRCLSIVLLAVGVGLPLPAQETSPADKPAEAVKPPVPVRQRPHVVPNMQRQPAAPPTVAELLRRLDATLAAAESIEATLRGKPADAVAKPADAGPKADVAVRLVPEDLHIDKVYRETKHVRYVAMQLWLVNATNAPVTVPLESIRLVTRGDELKPNQVPPRQGLPHIPFGGRLLPLQELSKSGPITVPAEGSTSVPIAFFDLPGTTDVPEMTLRVPVGDATAELDLNRYALGLMRLSIERLGPGGLLGLVTIDGELTPVGAGSLAEVIQKLTSSQATRVVLAWSDSAPPPPAELSTWLVQSATRLGTTALNNGRQPVLSPALVELHLASIPEGTGVPNYPGPRRVHETLDDAVAAALEGAYETIPLDVLVKEIEAGHPLTRPAAVAAGDRLPDDDLLLPLTADANPDIAAAAIHALRGHGSPDAIETLVELAKAGPESRRAAAVESLAASRYGAAHEALRELLDASANGVAVISPAALIPVLAEYPRPMWSDALHRLATQGDAAVRGDALAALAQLGHPQLTDAFRAALSSSEESLRGRAFTLVAWRQDAASEQLALDFTLNHLETEPPTRDMQLLIARTKDPRAVPLLLKHIEAGGAQRSDLVRLLIQIGGLEIREPLEEIYPKLDRETQRHVLGPLAEMRSPKIYEFAASALRSNDSALVNAAAQQLQADGGTEAVELLSEMLFDSDQPAVLSYIANGLAGIGTHEARMALRKADNAVGPRRDAARQAWWNLQRQSAGWEFFLAGIADKRREDWKDAVEHFSEAIEVDPQFIDAWSERASSNMQLKEFEAARTDYEQALRLDPYDAAAVTCLGILRAMDGRVEEGLAFVHDRADEFSKNDLFAYNTACLYAVASDRVEKTDPARAERLRADAVKELDRSIELGMTDPTSIAWIRKDPDLTSLRGRPDFEKVVVAAERKYGKEAPTGDQ